MAYKPLVLKVIGFLLVVLIAFQFYLQGNDAVEKEKIDTVANIHCPLQKQSCLINLSSNIKLNVSLDPKGFPAMEPLTLKLESKQIDFEALTKFEAVFKGRDMEMGQHSFVVSPAENPNTLVAKGLIPLCPMDPKMVWELNIKLGFQNQATLLKFEVSSDLNLNH